jgi:hypothetical protein
MREPKTRPTDADVAAHLDSLPDPRQRSEAQALARLMARVSGEPPVLWGSNIVGFGSYRVDYGNGRSYDWPLTGFAARAKELTLYLMDGFAQRADDLAALGRHRIGKSCLYLRSLAEVDLAVLEAMLQDSVRAMRSRPAVTGTAASDASDSTVKKKAAEKAATGKAAKKKATQPAPARKTAAKTQPKGAAARSAVSKPTPRKPVSTAAGKRSTGRR